MRYNPFLKEEVSSDNVTAIRTHNMREEISIFFLAFPRTKGIWAPIHTKKVNFSRKFVRRKLVPHTYGGVYWI